jgi:hypothetical protein
VETAFDSKPFFFTAPSTSELQDKVSAHTTRSRLAGDLFPPVLDVVNANKPRQIPGAWLGVRSPAFKASNKMKGAILGALALTPVPRVRHLFSGRDMFGGRCTISETGTTTVSFGDAHTPALADNIALREKDANWLSILAIKLVSSEKSVRRQMRALEYFYRAWPLDPSERFPVLCMALDAIFGDANHATGAIIDGIRSVVGSHVQDARLRHLMELRASVIHGGAPDVYDSRKYARYYDEFGDDPIHDLELLVGRCLGTKIFEGALEEHPDPAEDKIAQLQAQGHLPKKLSRRTILDDTTP